MHSLLRRQLRKHLSALETIPETWQPFLDAVESAYQQFDEDRGMLERSLELSSQELLRANAELRALFSAFPDLFFRVARDGTILDFKAEGSGELYLPRERILGKRVQDIPLGEVAEKLRVALARLDDGERMVAFEYSLPWEEGLRHYEARAVPVADEQSLVIVRNISERVKAEHDLQRGLSLLRSTLESTADGILVVDLAGNIVSYNHRFAQLWRIPPEALREGAYQQALAFALEQLQEPERFLAKVRELQADPCEESFDVLKFKDGRVFERHSLPQLLGGHPIGRVWCFRDVTVQKRVEAQLLFDAVHDPLTGLHNRSFFLERLSQAIHRSKRHPEHCYAVLFVDLDRFKVVNDSLGHAVGDELLVAVAQRLRQCVRPLDTLSRLGGDEFTILLEEIEGAGDALSVAERVHHAVEGSIELRGYEVYTSASIGIALGAAHYGRAEELLRDADTAMYRAKALGTSRHVLFQPGMHHSAVARLELETELRRVEERGELVLHFQPIVKLETGELVALEALLRWDHPAKGLIYPPDFLPVAEETGLLVPMGWWVLRQACAQLALWRRRHEGARDIAVTVNLSGRQLAHPALFPTLEGILEDQELPARCLVLEITEGALMDHSEASIERLGGLRDLGVRLYVDDFGTGYSSLSYLHRFPIDGLKVDRSFVGRIGVGGENLEIVRTIARLAQELEIDLIAEGVETASQRDLLCGLPCRLGQGFLFSAPADEEATRVMIAAERRWPRVAPASG